LVRRPRRESDDYILYPRQRTCKVCNEFVGPDHWCSECARKRVSLVGIGLAVSIPACACLVYITTHIEWQVFVMLFSLSALGFATVTLGEHLIGRRIRGE